MSRRHFTLALGAAVVAPLAAGVALVTPAEARPSDDTRALCEGAPVACSVQAPSTWRAGTVRQVAVTGTPGSDVVLHGVTVTPRASGRGHRFSTVVKGFRVEVGADGYGRADVRVPAGTDGGDLLFTVADSTAGDLTEVLGAWTTVQSTTPVLLGDGYGRLKPVGTDLSLDLEAAVPGSRYTVEMKAAGAWAPVSAGRSPACTDEGRCRIRYEVPRGLPAKRHEFRLVHTDSGVPVAHFDAVPDRDGEVVARRAEARPGPVGTAVDDSLAAGAADVPVTAARLANLQVPEVGTDLAFAAPRPTHDVARVRTVAGVLALLALVATVVLLRPRRRA